MTMNPDTKKYKESVQITREDIEKKGIEDILNSIKDDQNGVFNATLSGLQLVNPKELSELVGGYFIYVHNSDKHDGRIKFFRENAINCINSQIGKHGAKYVGIAFRPPGKSDKVLRKESFDDLITGYKISNQCPKEQLDIFIHNRDNPDPKRGIKATIYLPKKDGSIDLSVKDFPIVLEEADDFDNARLRYSENLDARVDLDEIPVTPEAIAAYHLLTQKSLEYGKRMPLVDSPMLIPSQRLVDCYNKINNNIILRNYNKNGLSMRVPTKCEKSLIEGFCIAEMGPEEAFIDPGKLKKLPTYKWD